MRHKTGRPEEAEEAYNKLENEKRSILFNKARWHEDSGRLEEATELYKKIIEESPKYTDAYLRLALIARHKNNYAEAIE